MVLQQCLTKPVWRGECGGSPHGLLHDKVRDRRCVFQAPDRQLSSAVSRHVLPERRTHNLILPKLGASLPSIVPVDRVVEEAYGLVIGRAHQHLRLVATRRPVHADAKHALPPDLGRQRVAFLPVLLRNVLLASPPQDVRDCLQHLDRQQAAVPGGQIRNKRCVQVSLQIVLQVGEKSLTQGLVHGVPCQTKHGPSANPPPVQREDERLADRHGGHGLPHNHDAAAARGVRHPPWVESEPVQFPGEPHPFHLPLAELVDPQLLPVMQGHIQPCLRHVLLGEPL
mmetsp:Transcript_52766/g.152121  ORF Transcript_52766/g.152121 Transcript_52766/m.152121 type:complete len:283 (+) Transcript_52766:499-1347(+)